MNTEQRLQQLERQMSDIINNINEFKFPETLDISNKTKINKNLFYSGNATIGIDGKVGVSIPDTGLKAIALNNQGYVSYLRNPDYLLYAAGTGYTVGNILTLANSGGATISVDAVSGGAITSYTTTSSGTSGISGVFTVTGGSGSGAQFYKNSGTELLIVGDPSIVVNFIVFLLTNGAKVN